ncbi:MAG: prolyl oligopeptidase family serine peptidase, partial [Bacteroidales bacterium]|nr:prolyl oligopeptidase family serine peptidase [Bacteroidales bacterium]
NISINVIINNKEDSLIYSNYHEIEYDEKEKRNYISFKFPGIDPDTYSLSVESIETNNKHVEFTILPVINTKQLQNELEVIKDNIALCDYTTLQYYIRSLENKMANLKRYHTYTNLIKEISVTKKLIANYLDGNRSLLMIKDDHRRAFISEIDNDLRPYSIKLPEDFDVTKEYSLMVFLHGSGRTDLNALRNHRYIIQDDFITIAPHGRGISNYYGTQESQKDINEAINDIIRNFNVDTNNIILSGFSMGGYGVYRTFYENPERYSALAIIAGEPNINFFQKIRGGEYPDFLKEKNIKHFLNVPIFIYHGVNDLNCPYLSTKELIEKLEENNANLTKFIFTEYGHSVPSGIEFNEKLRSWIMTNIKN